MSNIRLYIGMDTIKDKGGKKYPPLTRRDIINALTPFGAIFTLYEGLGVYPARDKETAIKTEKTTIVEFWNIGEEEKVYFVEKLLPKITEQLHQSCISYSSPRGIMRFCNNPNDDTWAHEYAQGA